MSDELLMMNIRDSNGKDHMSYRVLLERYEHRLLRFLTRILRNSEDAREVLQEISLRVFENCRLYDERRPFRSWVYTIAQRCAIDVLRKRNRHREIPYSTKLILDRSYGDNIHYIEFFESTPDPLCDDPNHDLAGDEKLERALMNLSDRERTLIDLIYFRRLKYREAADFISVPVGTIKSRLHTAIARLTELWKELEKCEAA